MAAEQVKELMRRAAALVKEGKPAEAGGVLDRLLELAPDNVQALYARAAVDVRLGGRKRAIEVLRRALRLKPDFAKAARLLERLEPESVPEAEEDLPVLQPVNEQPEDDDLILDAELIEKEPDEEEIPQVEPLPADGTPSAEEGLPVIELLEEDEPVVAENGFAEGEPAEVHRMSAELSLRAGLAIWAVLTVLMSVFAFLRSEGLVPAVVFMGSALGLYALGTLILSALSPSPIEPESADATGRRIHSVMSRVAERAGFPPPAIALAEGDNMPNAYTFGLSQNRAHVVVTQGLLDHVKPTDKELEAILAHEAGHIYHRDFIVSTLLRFPIWLLDKIRLLLYVARAVSGCVLQMASMFAFGLVGLIIVFGIIFMMIYLSIWIGILTAAIFVTVMFINSFEREREYVADQYSAGLLRDQRPLQSALAKLEQAQRRIEAVIAERSKEAGEDEEVDTDVAAPEQAFESRQFVGSSLAERPTVGRWLGRGEFLLTHPLTENRIYYLSHPAERGRLLSRCLDWVAGQVNQLAGPAGEAESARATGSLFVGAAVGLCVAILPVVVSEMLSYALSACAVALGGGMLALLALLGHWDGWTLTRRSLLAAFVGATTFLVAGLVVKNAYSFFFPFMFLVLAAVFGVIAVFGAGVLRRLAGPRPSSPTPEG